MPKLPSPPPKFKALAPGTPADYLENVNPETYMAPEERLRDVASLHSIYTNFRIADQESNRNRAMVDAMLDGEPPYDEAELSAAGQSERTNLDFGEGAAVLESSLAGYYDLTSSVAVLARLCVKPMPNYDANDLSEWEGNMSEEFTNTIKAWPEFESLFQRCCSTFVKHGVSIAYPEDDITWQFDVTGLGDFYIPRTTKATENKIEIAIADRSYLLHELYKYIRNESAATAAGWDVEEVQKALVNASRFEDQENRGYRRDWERLQRDLKNNDLGASYAKAVTVEAIHTWVQEFDGTVSHYISLQSGNNEEFLYKKPSRFKSMSEAFTVFTYGVGNGYYHSIRGLGYKLFPPVQVSNRLRGKAVDGAMFGSSVLVQPKDEKAMQALELTYVGPYAVLPPSFNVIERTLPNVAAQVLPVVNDLSMLIQNNTGSFRPRSAEPMGGGTKTARQVDVEVQSEAQLSTSAMNLFYLPWGRLLTTMALRMVAGKLGKSDKGGPEAIDFIRRCKLRGVPEDVIRGVVRAEPTRAVGYGSQQMRGLVFNNMLSVAGSFDEVGRNNLVRDVVAAGLGSYTAADRYLPRANMKPRNPIDVQIATIENNVMQSGAPLGVEDGQNHYIHASIHLPVLMQLSQQLAQLNEQPMNPQSIQQILSYMGSLLPHSAQHVEALSNDKLHHSEAGKMRQIIQQSDALMEGAAANLRKHMQAAQEQQQQAAQDQQDQQNQQAQQPPQDPKTQLQLQAAAQKHQQELVFNAQDHQQTMQERAQDGAQKRQLHDLAAAQKINQKREEQTGNVSSYIPPQAPVPGNAAASAGPLVS